MGKLTASYRKALIDEMLDNINSDTSCYYAFAANPNPDDLEKIPPVINNDYNVNFLNDWKMIFGKKLKYNNISPVVKRVIWKSGTKYTRYDNTVENLYENGNYYVYSQRVYKGIGDFGGGYYVYKCIDNNYDELLNMPGVSTVDPGSIDDPTQKITFETSDGYKWRYITTVSNKNMNRFSTGDLTLNDGLSPINPDQNIVTTAEYFSGVDVVAIENGGTGYAWNKGTIQSFTNSTVVEIKANTQIDPITNERVSPEASSEADFYKESAIYIYNENSATADLYRIKKYFLQSSSKFVEIDREANTLNIIPGATKYEIAPRLVFESDGIPPKAYCEVNWSNVISKVVIINPGSNISWANVAVLNNPQYGSGANLYPIVPPPGGHGADPASELNVRGFGVSFQFSNTESKQIPGDGLSYDKIGIIKNPYGLNKETLRKELRYKANTFNQLLVCNANKTAITGQTVIGQTSNSRGTLIYSVEDETSVKLSIIGDQTFQEGETIAYSNGVQISQIGILKRADVYSKDIYPMYVQNINKVTRANTQTEEFKLVVQL